MAIVGKWDSSGLDEVKPDPRIGFRRDRIGVVTGVGSPFGRDLNQLARHGVCAMAGRGPPYTGKRISDSFQRNPLRVNTKMVSPVRASVTVAVKRAWDSNR